MARSWAKQVAEGRRLVEEIGNRKWELGDLALEVAPVGPDGVNSGAASKLEEFASEIGVSFSVIESYRRAAHAWPAGKRFQAEQASWGVHYELRNRDDRFVFLGRLVKEAKGKRVTVDAARKAVGRKTGGYNPSNAPRQERAALARELLSDPDVAREVAADRDTRSNFSRAVVERDTQFVEEREEREPALRNIREEKEVHSAIYDLLVMQKKVGRILTDLREQNLGARERKEILEDTKRLAAAVDFLASYLEHGDMSWEEGLAKLLEGQS